MKKILFSKPTIVSILGLVSILIGFSYGIYGLTLEEGSSWVVAIVLGIVIVTLVIYSIDRFAVLNTETRKVNFAEGFLLICFVLICSYSDRELVFDIRQNNKNYFVLIENNGSFNNSELKYSFPFNKKMIVQKNSAVINSIEENYQRITIETPKKWAGLRMQPWSTNKINIQFYSNPEIEFTDKEIDSIITEEIKTAYNSEFKKLNF